MGNQMCVSDKSTTRFDVDFEKVVSSYALYF